MSALAQQKSPRRAALASWIGSALEYYDFAVFGTAAALVLGPIFFPDDSDAAGILKSMMVLGVAYVVRPLGVMSRDVVESVEGYAANRRVVSVVVVEVEPAGQRQASFGL